LHFERDPIPLGKLDTATALAVSPEGDRLAAGGPSGGVRLWAVADNPRPADPPVGQHRWQAGTRPITSLAFTRDGARLGVGTEDGRLVLYDTALGLELVNATLGEGAVSGLAFAPDGRKLAVIHGERVLLWE